MPVEARDFERAAGEYAGRLPESFSDRNVSLTGTYQGRRRMTLTEPVLERARNVLWLITGRTRWTRSRACAPATIRSPPAGSPPPMLW